MNGYKTDKNKGLTTNEVTERLNNGYVNHDTPTNSKTISEIVRDNTFTLFNFLNLFLGLAIVLVGSYKNLLFLGVVICNTLIGIIQEIYAKKTVDKLSLLKDTKVTVIRDGILQIIDINEIVIDDLMELKTGEQVICDAIILDGFCEVNESFVTGESKPIYKKVNDNLLSGSFIVGGYVRSQVKNVGDENYIGKITKAAKGLSKPKSELMSSLKKVIKIISFVIVPIGLIFFYKQYNLPNNNLTNSVINTVAALIAMIPEGLVLLTSTVLAVSVIRLARYKVLVQDLFSIESLARINVLCLDKTGTLTTGEIEFTDTILVDDKYDTNEILRAFANNLDKNGVNDAISIRYSEETNLNITEKFYFSSEKKWSGITVDKKGSFILGAPEIILKDNYYLVEDLVLKYANEYRVLVLTHTYSKIEKNKLANNLMPIAILLFRDKIREEVFSTLKYFDEQGVKVKIISGDNILTVIGIASRVGLDISNNYIDASNLSDLELKNAVIKNDYFGRVSPFQKKIIVETLKKRGFVVGFIGDGVNDVLALKEADCSIALSNGSEAAANVSKLVLLDSNFLSLPEIVLEGRRTINNITRSAILFITKTTYATILIFLFLFINRPYPFMPIQFTLTSIFTIGIPAFILALEPNYSLVKGNFLTNVISRAFAPALTIVSNIIIVMIVSSIMNLTKLQFSTLSVILTGYTGFLLLFNLSKPFNTIRIILNIAMIAGFVISVIGLRGLFSLAILTPYMIIYIISLILISTLIYNFYNKIYYVIEKKIRGRNIWKIG